MLPNSPGMGPQWGSREAPGRPPILLRNIHGQCYFAVAIRSRPDCTGAIA